MRDGRRRIGPGLAALLLLVASSSAAVAQPAADKAPPGSYVVVRCINTPGGKGDAYRDYMLSTTAKTMQVRADEGNIDGWIFARANLPGSGQAECDFLQMNLHKRFPPARTPIDPYFVKAGVKTTRQEWYARLGEMTKLIWVEMWRGVESEGQVKKGNFIRLDLLKLVPAQTDDWKRLQGQLWRPVFHSALARGAITAWWADELVLPAGSSHPYGARRMTAFRDWDAIGPFLDAQANQGMVRQVLRGRAPALLAREARASELVRSSLYEVVEAIWPAGSAPRSMTPPAAPSPSSSNSGPAPASTPVN